MTRRSFLTSLAASCALPLLAIESPFEALFSTESVRSDLDAIWTTLVDVGAKPFATSNRAEVEAIYRRSREAVTGPTSLRDAYLAIAPMLGALNDGHVGMGFPKAQNDAPRAFPLRFAPGNMGGLDIVSDRTGTIPAGSRLLSVNDVLADRFAEVFRRDVGGQTASLRRARVTGSGAWPSVALAGFTGPYRVRYRALDGTERVISLDSTSVSRAFSHRSPSEPYVYRELRNGSVGLIDYRSCEDLPRFQTFLRESFKSIQTSGARALVIDIRNNGGGDSSLNDALWPFVSAKPFKQFGGGVVKACDRLKREYGQNRYVAVYGQDAWDAPDGTLLTSGEDPNSDLVDPGKNPLRFAGPVYLLISALTFSSAMSCALAAKDYGLATIVGEETGEPVNSTGEVYTEVTAGLGLQAYLTTKYFMAPRRHPDGQGVVPDVAVVTTVADIAAARDPVMERVLALIDRDASQPTAS